MAETSKVLKQICCCSTTASVWKCRRRRRFPPLSRFGSHANFPLVCVYPPTPPPPPPKEFPLYTNSASTDTENRLLFQHDWQRKPQGVIVLDDSSRVSRSADKSSNTFEIATKGRGEKTYYLTADSTPLMEEWVRTLQNVIQRNALEQLLRSEDQV